MWGYRELIRNLTLSEIKNRYQNNALGFLWSILAPLLLAFVLWFVFRKIFKGDDNYAINLIVAMMVWRFFATGTSMGLSSVVSHSGLVTKVFIPRHYLVFSTVLANVFTSFFELLILIPLVYVFTGRIPITILLFPFMFLLYFWLVYGIGLMLAALYVYMRDLSHIWDVVVNILFFCTPIIYPMTVVPLELQPYYLVNPLTNIIFVYRDIMVSGVLPSWNNIMYIVLFGAFFFLIGSLFFNKMQRRFAEVI
jgi:lipopolysaccharide transport system permease protein